MAPGITEEAGAIDRHDDSVNGNDAHDAQTPGKSCLFRLLCRVMGEVQLEEGTDS